MRFQYIYSAYCLTYVPMYLFMRCTENGIRELEGEEEYTRRWLPFGPVSLRQRVSTRHGKWCVPLCAQDLLFISSIALTSTDISIIRCSIALNRFLLLNLGYLIIGQANIRSVILYRSV